MALGAICFDFSFNSKSVFAYSASITTDNSTVLNVSVNGTGTSIVEKSINVTSDCRNGYNLVVSTTESSDLYLNGNSSGTAAFTAVNGTSTLANSTNKWGYTLTSNPSPSTVFSPLSTTASTLKTPSETASPSSDINDTFPIYYGVKVDDTVSPGSYEMGNNGVIVYYLTMDTTCTQYTVSFNANGGTGTIANQNIQAGESTKLTTADTLTAPTGASYTDANNNTINGQADKLWTFWGWNTAIDGTGDWYKDKEVVEDLANAGSTITLYAQWKQATLADLTAGTQVGTEKVIDHNLMQDMSPEACWNSTAYVTSTSSPAHNPFDPSTNPDGYHTITLLDYRGKITTGDNPESPEQYTVVKLPDGLCWMTENLRLGRETGGPNGNGTVTLTPQDSDITGANYTLPASNTAFETSNNSYSVSKMLIDNTYGYYYSFAAATAGTSSGSYMNASATKSICPKNWDLPTKYQYDNLKTKASLTNYSSAHAAPYNFTYGGYRNGSSFSSQSNSIRMWTSTHYSSNQAYYSSSYQTASYSNNYKRYGEFVRCVASGGTVTINYDGNGTNEYPVTGTTASQVNAEIVSAKTQTNGFTRDNWTFSGWNTAADGSGTAISANANISNLDLKPGEVVTLYAQWLPQYTITYVNNCQTYASANSSCTQDVSDSTGTQKINLANNPSTGSETGTLGTYNYNSWTLTGWKIAGWSTVANNSDYTNTEYKVSSTYTVPASSSVGSGITLYAHWVPVYSIQYDGNGADNTNGMGTTDSSTGIKSVKQINVGEGDSVVLLASNFKRAGYGFVGWSTDANAWDHFTDNNANNDPIIYGTMETISAPAYPNNGTGIITFYAVWVPVEKDGNNNPVYLQEWDDPANLADGCATLTKVDFDDTITNEKDKIIVNKNSIIALTDKRDNMVYTVAKLADGNCWMVDNLRLNNQYTMGQNQNDPNVTNESLAQGYGGTPGTYGSFVGLADSESNFTSNLTSSNSVYKSAANPPVDTYNPSASTLEDIGTSNGPSYRFPRYNNSNTYNLVDSTTYIQNYNNASNPSISGTYSQSNVYSYGNYYTWAAAMANTDYFDNQSLSEGVGTSICPAGWHLPSSYGAAKEFGSLSRGYGGSGSEESASTRSIMSNRFRSFPNNFLYSGQYYNNTNIINRGSKAEYWSRTNQTNGSTWAYAFRIAQAQFEVSGSSSGKGAGFNVRCLINSTYTIQYDGNGADNPNGMGITSISGNKSVKQIEISEDTKITLLAPNFKKDGYGFVGWSTDVDAWTHFTDNDNTNDPVIYGPMEDVTVDASVISYSNKNSIITMYAVWAPAEKDGSNNSVYLQDFTSSDCNALTKANFNSTTGKITPGSVIALTDKRDNQVYAVAKLADDNCWMIENLRLEHAGTVGNNINDSSVTNQSLSQGYGGTVGTYGSFVGLADSESANFDNVTTSNSIYKSSAALPTDTYDSANNVLEDIGTSDTPQYRFPRYNSSNTQSLVDSTTYIQDYANVSSPTDTPSSNYYRTQNLYSYGNYYSWAAAMANTNNYVGSSNSEAANTSICPFNWHLPSSGTTTAEYGTLSRSYGGTGSNQTNESSFGDVMSNRFRSFPNNFLYSGNIGGKTFYDRGKEGTYWSRSSKASADANILYFYSIYLGPSLPNTKYQGQSVRCLIGS